MKVTVDTPHGPLELDLPRIKFGVMGRPGSGKSELLASMPKPLFVYATDPEEKLMPYFDRCGRIERGVGQFGQPVLIGFSPTTDKPIMQVELFYDLEPSSPSAVTQLLARAQQVRGEVDAGMWASVALDSWSQLETFAVWRRTWGTMAAKDADAHGRNYGAAKDDLKPFFWSWLIPLKCNLGIAFHTTEKLREESGVSSYGIKAIGDLPSGLASVLPERYRSESQADGSTRKLYTKPDGRYDLCTLIDAPNPCDNHYPALFTNWINKRVAMAAAAKPAPADPAPQKEGDSK